MALLVFSLLYCYGLDVFCTVRADFALLVLVWCVGLALRRSRQWMVKLLLLTQWRVVIKVGVW